jgi:CheY-like chemotaxis protein
VLLNLGINAARSMPTGGRITFTSTVTELEPEHCDDSPFELQPGRHLRVEVRDTGPGIPPEQMKRIFDPFFTTQQTGTGLGLSAVYGSIRQHKGAVTVYSEPGAGTVFRIMLRLTDEPIAKATAPRLPVGKGKVLLVEDEAAIRSISSRFLKRMGFEVTTSEDGQPAIDVFRAAEGRFVLVILDMVMPKMNGTDCFRALKELDPSVKVLLCSGFVGGNDVDALLGEGARGFISKPYQYHELGQAVAEAIGSD